MMPNSYDSNYVQYVADEHVDAEVGVDVDAGVDGNVAASDVATDDAGADVDAEVDDLEFATVLAAMMTRAVAAQLLLEEDAPSDSLP